MSRERDAALAGRAAVGVASTFCASLAATRSFDLAEDLTDLCHSLVGTICSARAFFTDGGLRPAPPRSSSGTVTLRSGIAARERLLNAPVLPPDEDATARKFVLCSTTYFALDVAHIFASLIAGRARRSSGAADWRITSSNLWPTCLRSSAATRPPPP